MIQPRNKKKIIDILLVMLILILMIRMIHAYAVDPPNKVVHQHITKEALEVWPLIPYEIKEHATNPLDINIHDSFAIPKEWSYHVGDDIIDGSGEEDVPITEAFQHFWEPDNTQNGRYNDGLNIIGFFNQDSSYRKALGYWKEYVIPNYVKGDKDEAYYWLGRVAHLLEDATVSKELFF